MKAPGDEPTFVLELDGATYETYGADRRDVAFSDWCSLAGDYLGGPAAAWRGAAIEVVAA